MVIIPVPPTGFTFIKPSQSSLQVGLNENMLGGGRLGGPGCTNTVSGPNPPCS